MARIRSIKPEFWTSEQIAECSPNVRLLFIGMWNFCDDYGVHPASEMRLKMEVFPSDAFTKDDIRRMIDELLSNGLLTEYEVSGTLYWWVTGWDKHQKPDCKTGLYPRPDGNVGAKIRRTVAEDSPNIRGTFAQGEGEGEVKGEGNKKTKTRSAKASLTFSEWVDSLNGEKPLRDDDPLFEYCRNAGISTEIIIVCWKRFKDEYAASDKKYKDWREVFRKAVRGNWHKVYFLTDDGSEAKLTTVGISAMRVHQEAA